MVKSLTIAAPWILMSERKKQLFWSLFSCESFRQKAQRTEERATLHVQSSLWFKKHVVDGWQSTWMK